MKKKSIKRLTAILCTACILLSACGNTVPETGGGTGGSTPAPQSTDSPEPVKTVTGNIIDLSSGVTANAVSIDRKKNPSATTAATDFGLRMLQQNMAPGQNILLSPASVLFALGMTANGARENTLAQFEKVFGMSIDELNNYLCAYRQSLPNEEKCKVTTANSIWFKNDPGLSVLPEFLQLNADYYAASICKAPFDDSTKNAINEWVKKNTDNMIEQILDQIPAEAVMYLVNAMAFDAKWMNPYYERDVREGDFTKEDGTVQRADFMYSTEQKYLETENAVGFLKYYDGQKYAFAALLPNEGTSPEACAASLTGEKLNRILNSPTDIKVYASIPKFEAEYSTELGRTLSAMGLTDAFDPEKADLSGLGTSADGNLFISQVLHKTYICVDEKGTKAAAVTAVETKKECIMIEPDYKTVYLDRPFLYFLVDCEEGLPIFMGAVCGIE